MYERLYDGVLYRDVDAVRGALAAGADPHFAVGKQGYYTTALHAAVSRARALRAEKVDVLVRYPQAAHTELACEL